MSGYSTLLTCSSTLNENFRVATDVRSAAKQIQFKKNIQNWEKFVITRVHCTKDIFIMSTIQTFVWMRRVKTFHNRIFTLHERFGIIYNENIHFFDVYSIEICFYSNSQFANFCQWNFQRLKRNFSKRICYYLNLNTPGNFSPHYWSGIKLHLGKIGI